MKPFVTSLVVLVLSVVGLVADWSGPIAKLERSSIYVNSDDGSCTRFVIHSAAREKKDKDFVLTAAHCDGAKLYADHVPARVIFKDDKRDLLVLEVEDLDRPALPLAKDNPKIGDEIASYGYGYALDRPMFRIAHISDTALYIPEGGIGGPFIATDTPFIGGMSGGPVVNNRGEIVLIVQRASNAMGIGVGADVIRAAVGRYFESK